MAGEPNEMVRAEKGPIEPRRRDLENVGIRNGVLHVEHRTYLPACHLAVPNRDSGIVVDEYPQNRAGFGSLQLDSHQLVAESR